MFNKKKIKELEQKVEELSKILKVIWVEEHTYDTYSPPTVFYNKFKAGENILTLLLDYLNLEVVITPKIIREDIEEGIKIVKKKKAKKLPRPNKTEKVIKA